MFKMNCDWLIGCATYDWFGSKNDEERGGDDARQAEHDSAENLAGSAFFRVHIVVILVGRLVLVIREVL